VAAANDTKQLLTAVARLTGDPGRKVRHGKLFRAEVTSSDGKPCARTVQVNTGRNPPPKASMTDIARRLIVDPAGLPNVLDNWSADDLEQHLSQYTEAELKPPGLGGRTQP